MASSPHIQPSARADARRNREALLEAAATAFAAAEETVPLDAIARSAGVGIGTLYRHFPTREDLVEAVYRDQVERLHTGAAELLQSRSPSEALRAWMDLFADWAATKHGMVEALAAVMASGRVEGTEMRAELVAIVREFLLAGADAGDLRDDVEPEDVAATLAGVLVVAGGADQRDQTTRMLNLVADGLRPGPIAPTIGPAGR